MINQAREQTNHRAIGRTYDRERMSPWSCSSGGIFEIATSSGGILSHPVLTIKLYRYNRLPKSQSETFPKQVAASR